MTSKIVGVAVEARSRNMVLHREADGTPVVCVSGRTGAPEAWIPARPDQ
jgi:hypothetical protein